MLQCTGKRLPEWAFQQYEVVTEKEVGSSSNVWSLDEIILPSSPNTSAWAEEERGEGVYMQCIYQSLSPSPSLSLSLVQ